MGLALGLPKPSSAFDSTSGTFERLNNTFIRRAHHKMQEKVGHSKLIKKRDEKMRAY